MKNQKKMHGAMDEWGIWLIELDRNQIHRPVKIPNATRHCNLGQSFRRTI